MQKTITHKLTDVERSQLKQDEATVRKGIKSFLAVGTALKRIKERKPPIVSRLLRTEMGHIQQRNQSPNYFRWLRQRPRRAIAKGKARSTTTAY